MAMAHLSVRAHTRSLGHTAAAGAAYRLGISLACPRLRVTSDFSRRSDRGEVAAGGIAAPRPTPIAASPQSWVEAVEAHEKRKNSQIMRDVEVSLPHELSAEQRRLLAEDFAKWLAAEYDTPTLWAVHRPERRGDGRNHHVHILMPTRALDESGEGFGAKLRQLNDRADSRAELKKMRSEWERRCNQALAAAGVNEWIDMGRKPGGAIQFHLGPKAAGIERDHAQAPEGVPLSEVVVATGGRTERGRQLADDIQSERQALRMAAVADASVEAEPDLQDARDLIEDPLVEPVQTYRPGVLHQWWNELRQAWRSPVATAPIEPLPAYQPSFLRQWWREVRTAWRPYFPAIPVEPPAAYRPGTLARWWDQCLQAWGPPFTAASLEPEPTPDAGAAQAWAEIREEGRATLLQAASVVAQDPSQERFADPKPKPKPKRRPQPRGPR